MPDLVFFDDLKDALSAAQNLREKEIIIARSYDSAKALEEARRKAGKQKTKFFFCHLLRKLDTGEIKEFRGAADFLAVLGGNIAANKFAAGTKGIDFLLQPVNNARFEFDSAIANTARDNNTAIALLFSDFLNASQYDKISFFRNFFLLSKVCRRARVQLLAFSGARSKIEMRAQADLQAFLALLQQGDFSDETED